MRNAATYASSSSTNFAEYEDLPGHHLLSIHSLIASSPNDSYPETASSIADDVNFFMNNFTAEEAKDYFGVRNPDAFRSFQLATAYCLTCSEDSSEGDYDPARECFMADLADQQDDNAPGDYGDGGVDPQANQPVVPPAAPSSSSSSAARKHSWRSSRSFRPSSTSSVGRLRSCTPHSSNIAPRMAHLPRQQHALPGSRS